jgi:hypothetical protein
MKNIILLVIFLFVFFLVACGSSSVPIENTPVPPFFVNQMDELPAYPAPQDPQTPGYPAPADYQEQLGDLAPYISPQVTIVDDSKGAVVGRLVSRQLSIPIANVRVYLGERTPLAGTDGEFVVTMREQSSFFGLTDENGYFIINLVNPETYGLIAFLPIEAKLLNDDKGDPFYVTVQPGHVIDVGDRIIAFP